MKAIILAAGSGNRLKPLTNDMPKTLLKIKGKTILERIIENCGKGRINEFVIVVGYNKEKVFSFIKNLNCKEIKCLFVESKDYQNTNTGVSLYLALKDISDDIVIINGDNIFEFKILENLIKVGKSAIVVDNIKRLNEESFKIVINNNRIDEIGKDIDKGKASGEFIGISIIVKKDINTFIMLLKKLIDNNKNNYYDFAFKEFSESNDMGFVYTNGLKWTEIDDLNDLKYAEKMGL